MLRDFYGGNANTSAMVIQDIQQDHQIEEDTQGGGTE